MRKIDMQTWKKSLLFGLSSLIFSLLRMQSANTAFFFSLSLSLFKKGLRALSYNLCELCDFAVYTCSFWVPQSFRLFFLLFPLKVVVASELNGGTMGRPGLRMEGIVSCSSLFIAILLPREMALSWLGSKKLRISTPSPPTCWKKMLIWNASLNIYHNSKYLSIWALVLMVTELISAQSKCTQALTVIFAFYAWAPLLISHLHCVKGSHIKS